MIAVRWSDEVDLAARRRLGDARPEMSSTLSQGPLSARSAPGSAIVAGLACIGLGYLTFCLAALIFTLASDAKGGVLDALPGALLIPFLGLFVGPVVGLVSTAPYFSAGFKLALLFALIGILGLFMVGLRFRRAWWGKLLAIGAVWLWILAGLVGFGPQ